MSAENHTCSTRRQWLGSSLYAPITCRVTPQYTAINQVLHLSRLVLYNGLICTVVNVIVFVVASSLSPPSLAVVRLSSSLSCHYRCRCLPSRQCRRVVAMTSLSSLFSPCHYRRRCVPCRHCHRARSPRPVVENFAKQPVNLKRAPPPVVPSITGDIPATDSRVDCSLFCQYLLSVAGPGLQRTANDCNLFCHFFPWCPFSNLNAKATAP